MAPDPSASLDLTVEPDPGARHAVSFPVARRGYEPHRVDHVVEGLAVEIEGLRGRPTEGFLGFLFDLVGEGQVQWNRMTLSADGLQVARARAAKGPFHVESTITVFPDGRVEKDLPKGREDLAPLEKRLLQPRRIRYLPLESKRAPADPAR